MGHRKPLSRYFYNLDAFAEDDVRKELREKAQKLTSRITMGIIATTSAIGAYVGATTFYPYIGFGIMAGGTVGATVGMFSSIPVKTNFEEWYGDKLIRNWEKAGKPLSPPYDKSIIEQDREYRRKLKEEEFKKNKDNDKSLSNEKSSNEKENKLIPKFSGVFKHKSLSLKQKEQKTLQNDMGRGND